MMDYKGRGKQKNEEGGKMKKIKGIGVKIVRKRKEERRKRKEEYEKLMKNEGIGEKKGRGKGVERRMK